MKIFIFLSAFATAFACTDFIVEANDGGLINGRTLEFAQELNSKLNVFPRGMHMQSKAPGNQSGISWRSKYGFLGVTALGVDLAMDGMNEKGLSFGYLWLPGYTKYPQIRGGSNILDFVDLGMWILGNFATVAEVKQAIAGLQIWGHPVKGLGEAPVHVTVHDSQGKSIVIEFTYGQMFVYDNPLGVLTNSPPFPWQLMNIQNYLSLNPENPEPTTFRGLKLSPPGEGSGMFGLPGDWTPPSRFVKIATLLRFVQPAKTTAEACNLTEHLLNTVDIPFGAVGEKGGAYDYTQWICMKDLKNRVFFFRSYRDLNMKMVDLKKINFDRVETKSLPMDMEEGYIDVTHQLMGRITVSKD